MLRRTIIFVEVWQLRGAGAMRMRALKAFLVASTLLVTTTGLTAGAVAAGPYCGITWGSLTKARAGMTRAPIVAARAGEHACYDRLVIELAGPTAGYNVRYVNQVTDVADGDVIPLRGGAFLQIVVRAPAYDSQGRATYAPANPAEAVPVAGYRTFRQIAFGGSFEGVTIFGAGVRARLPFRVLVVAGPGGHSRLVIDVAHRW